MILFILGIILVSAKFILSHPKGEELKLTLNNTLLLFALIPPIVNIPLFTTVPLTRDKTNGTMINLLATPLSPEEIVCGKSLAIFLPGYIISVLAPLVIMLIVNFILIIPSDGSFYIKLPLLLDIFIVSPIFCYGLTRFTIELSMIKSPELAISPSYLIGFMLIIGIPLCSSMGIVDLTSWKFLMIYSGVALFVWLLVLGFQAMLTKERIIL